MPKYRVMNSHMRREKPPIKYKEIPFKYKYININIYIIYTAIYIYIYL